MNYWLLKSVSEESQTYKSNDGYPDEFKNKYVYDNFVPNHKRIVRGDIVAIVDKKKILGLTRISRILIYNSSKIMRRCPICNSTNYEERKNKFPKYRCNKGHEFEEVKSESVDVIRYEAFYSDVFILPKRDVTVDKIKPYFHKNYNRNMSMQSLSEAFFIDFFSDELEHLKTGLIYLTGNDSENFFSDLFSGDYVPNGNDERARVYQSIIQRRGQKKFRDAVREMYGDKCVITGCEILDVLEAAHINPYKGVKDNHPSNGLLLRADIHTLFDLDLIGIEPNEFKVYFSQALKKSEYIELEGKRLILKEGQFPSKEALNIRWKSFYK